MRPELLRCDFSLKRLMQMAMCVAEWSTPQKCLHLEQRVDVLIQGEVSNRLIQVIVGIQDQVPLEYSQSL